MPDPQQVQSNSNDGFTPVKLKDGTTIKLKGSNLNPQQVAAGVAKFRAAQPSLQKPPAAQASPQAPPQVPPQQPSSSSNPVPPYQGGAAGFTPSNLIKGVGEGIKGFINGIVGANPVFPGPHGETRGEGNLIDLLGNIDKHWPEFLEQRKDILKEAKAANEEYKKTGSEMKSADVNAKLLFAHIPFMGSWLNDKYNQARSGDVGGAGSEVGTIFALGKLTEALQDKGVKTVEDFKGAVPKHAIIAASNKVLDDLKDTQVGKTGVRLSQDNSALGIAIKAKKASIEGNVSGLLAKDRAANPGGASPKGLIVNVIDQAINDKDAKELQSGGYLPETTAVRKLVTENYGNNLTLSNIKDIRSIIGELKDRASGKDLAVLGDLYSSFTDHAEGLSKQIGGLKEWMEYNEETEKLSNLQKGIIKQLKDHDTGLQYGNFISKESNAGRLSDLESDIGLPKDFFKNTVNDFGPVRRFANLSEGGSETGVKGGRLGAVMRHLPVTGPAMVATGFAMKPFASGIPYANYVMALGTAIKLDDFMNRMDAARAIRELGGPDGVTGRYGMPESFQGNKGPSGPPAPGPQRPAGPSNLPPGPSGGVSPTPQPPPTVNPAGSLPSGSPKGLSPALEKLVPKEAPLPSHDELMEAMIKKGVDNALADKSATQRLDAASGKPGYQDVERRAAKQLIDQYMGPERRATVTKVPEEARGREPSARSGMTKDTLEARRAKARERIAAKREESMRTQQKSSLEDQARQIAGKMDLLNRSTPELEEGLQELYGDRGKIFLKEFKKIGKQQGWTEDVYRGYLQDTIDKRAKELASRPNIPGTETLPKN
jgi:hypothetical protein